MSCHPDKVLPQHHFQHLRWWNTGSVDGDNNPSQNIFHHKQSYKSFYPSVYPLCGLQSDQLIHPHPYSIQRKSFLYTDGSQMPESQSRTDGSNRIPLPRQFPQYDPCEAETWYVCPNPYKSYISHYCLILLLSQNRSPAPSHTDTDNLRQIQLPSHGSTDPPPASLQRHPNP